MVAGAAKISTGTGGKAPALPQPEIAWMAMAPK